MPFGCCWLFACCKPVELRAPSPSSVNQELDGSAAFWSAISQSRMLVNGMSLTCVELRPSTRNISSLAPKVHEGFVFVVRGLLEDKALGLLAGLYPRQLNPPLSHRAQIGFVSSHFFLLKTPCHYSNYEYGQRTNKVQEPTFAYTLYIHVPTGLEHLKTYRGTNLSCRKWG